MTNVLKPSQLLIAFVSLFIFLGGCNAQELKAAEKPTEPTTSGEKKKMSANPVIKIETSKGTMMLELDAEKAPNTVANFVSYVEDGFYFLEIQLPRFQCDAAPSRPMLMKPV